MRDVAFSCDDNGVPFLKVSVWSLLAHYKGSEPIRVNVFEGWGGHSAAHKSEIAEIVGRFPNAMLRYVNVEPAVEPYCDLVLNREKSRWNVFTWTPIFTPQLLSDATGNVIHFDIDMLFNADVSELFEMDLGDNFIACTYEYDKYGDNAGKVVWEKGILPSTVERYFNTGVLVFNVEACRVERTWEKIVEWYKAHYDIADRIEQDAWNALYHDRVLPLNVKWNFHDRAIKSYAKWGLGAKYWLGNTPRECLDAAIAPSLLHFWGPKKPWKVSHRPYRKLYHAAMRAVGQEAPCESLLAPCYNFMNAYYLARIRARQSALAGRRGVRSPRAFSRRDGVVIAALSAIVGGVLPLQTYLGNADIYPFPLVRLLPELLGLSLAFVLGLTLLQLLFRLARLSATPVFAALAVCAYLEPGILSAGLPELNGGFVRELSDAGRAAFDLSFWVALVVVFIACSRKMKGMLHWIAFSALALSCAALFDVRTDESAARADSESAAGITTGFEPQPTVVANVRYSSVRNILVFILDSMPGLDIAEILQTESSLQEKFAGFTAYANNVGMHECTKRGVPGIVTGRHYDWIDMPEGEYPMTMYGTNSFVWAAVTAGWNVAFSPDLLPYGFTNLPIEQRVARVEKRRSRDVLAILRQSLEVPYLSLFDVVAFRLSPFVAKGPILYSRIRHAVKGRHSDDGFWGEKMQYATLAACPTDEGARPFLGVFHTWGAHPPWENGFTSMAVGKLSALGELMDAYRARGLYDKSLIVVTSDHGLDMAKPIAGFPPSASALLWVKPQGVTAPFVESALQTSHARISSLVKAAIKKPLTRASCEELLLEENPLYRAEIREGGREYFKDWRMR